MGVKLVRDELVNIQDADKLSRFSAIKHVVAFCLDLLKANCPTLIVSRMASFFIPQRSPHLVWLRLSDPLNRRSMLDDDDLCDPNALRLTHVRFTGLSE